MDDWKELCARQVVASVAVNNAASVLQTADRHGLQPLRDHCLGFICDRFDDVSKSSAFQQMCQTNGPLLVEVLKRR